MNLIYGIKDKPKFVQLIVFALQQMLAIMAATLVVPVLVNANGVQNLEMDIAAALLGAGMGTGVYIAFTKAKSPVFLGSSFAFLSAMYSATAFGYFGIIVGAILAGLVYVVIAIAIKAFGTRWIDKLMPPIIIGQRLPSSASPLQEAPSAILPTSLPAPIASSISSADS